MKLLDIADMHRFFCVYFYTTISSYLGRNRFSWELQNAPVTHFQYNYIISINLAGSVAIEREKLLMLRVNVEIDDLTSDKLDLG